ncbi:MAG: nucleotidyltransferase family protein [Nanoarchaeota archaeon]
MNFIIKPKIIKILKKYGVKKASLFGSYVRGEQRRNSDIDILIEPPKGMGLEFVGMALDLEEGLKRKVDLVTYKGINPHLKKYILEDEVKII